MGAQRIINPEISIIVPIWNDAESVSVFVNTIVGLLEKTVDYEIIFCVDPSSDETEELIRSLASKESRIKAIFFATKAGQPASTLAGLRHARGQACIVIDVDLQDPPELLPKMIDYWRQGESLVIPRRVSRSGEPISKKLTASIGYAFLSKFGTSRIPKNTGDFRLMDRVVVERVLALRESHVFLRGLVGLVNVKPRFIDFIRPPRRHGRTKYNRWFGGVRSGLNGIVSYSHALLDSIIILGFLLAFFSFALGTRYVIYKLGGNEVPPGNAQLFAMVTFIGGVQLVSIGVVGLYIGSIFDEVKMRPRWVIADTIGITDIDPFDFSRTGRFMEG